MLFTTSKLRPSVVFSGSCVGGLRRGYVLVLVSLMAVVLFGIVGLGVDIGHMYATRAEAQTFCDAAALAAAAKLDGKTMAAITDGRIAAFATQKLYDMGSKPFTDRGSAATGVTIQVGFGTTENGPFDPAPASANNITFAEVRATVNVDAWLLPVLTGQSTATIAARAVAGRQSVTEFQMGLGPFAPIYGKKAYQWCTENGYDMTGCAYNSGPDIFGLVKGTLYTLRWPSGTGTGQSPGLKDWASMDQSEKDALCAGDRCECAVAYARLTGMDTRGYALYGSASDIRKAILGSPEPLNPPLVIGGEFDLSNGNIQSEMDALAERVRKDHDPTSETYAEYLAARSGNGLREMPVPLLTWPDNAALTKNMSFKAAGFAGFFLLKDGTYNVADVYGGGKPPSKQATCAEYFGEVTYGSPGTGGGSGTANKVYVLRLYR